MSASFLADHAAGNVPVLAGAGVAKVAVFNDFETARAAWGVLEETGIGPGYQHIAYLEAWQTNIGAREGCTPAIVAGFGPDGAPRFLWPFCRRPSGPMTVLEWMGAKHANTNIGLYAPDLAAAMPAGFADAAIEAARREGLSFDLLRLINQPELFDGFRSPLLDTGTLVGAEGLPSRKFGEDRDPGKVLLSTAGRNSRRNWRRIAEHYGTPEMRRAEDQATVDAWLAEFREQKTVRFAELGINDVFGDPGVPEFLAEASRITGKLPPALEIHALLGGETVLAVAGFVPGKHRMSCVFLSDLAGEARSFGPGTLMMNEMGLLAARRGAESFDAGIGLQRYKMGVCDVIDSVFETYRGYTPLGRLSVAAMHVRADAKRRIKQSPLLWSVVTRLRKLRARDARAPETAGEG